MHPRSSLTEAQRGAAVALFEQGRGYTATATHLGISRWAVRGLHRRWRVRGMGALVGKPTKSSYSLEFKLEVVGRVVDDGATAEELAGEYGLSSGKLVRSWVRAYRRFGEDGLKPKPKGRPPKDGDAPPGEVTDLARLEQENLRLRAENAYLKKLRALMAQERR
jgi:transposase-like protein